MLLVLLASCVHERPSDLRLEQVYVVDIFTNPVYKRGVAAGSTAPLLRLVVELSTSETFPLGARMVWGLCGEERWWLDGLDKETAPNTGSASDSAIHDTSDRHLFIAIPALVFEVVPPSPEFPPYDLWTDNHDTCLNTGSGTYTDVWKSNEVRIPRSMIEKALREPPHTRIPLDPNDVS